MGAFPAPDIAALFPDMREVSLGRGDVLYAPGAVVEQVFFPSSAVLSSVTVMADDRSVEAATLGYESVAGLLPGLTGGISGPRVFAQIAGAGITLPGTRLRARAGESPALMTLLLRHAAAEALQAQQSVACNVLHEGPARLARWLLTTSDRTGGTTFALTQDYMAIMVGMQRSTVSLLASALKDEGLIDYTRGAVEICDRPRLEQRACECYRVIRGAYEALTSA